MKSAYNYSPSLTDELTSRADSLAVSQTNSPAQADLFLSVKHNKGSRDIAFCQEVIANFFLNQIKSQSPSWLLQEFENLFIAPFQVSIPEVNTALAQIIEAQQEASFQNLLLRICHILVNNWKFSRHSQYIKSFIAVLENLPEIDPTASRLDKQLRSWLVLFVKSATFNQFKNITETQVSQEQKKKNKLDPLAIDFESYRRQKAAEEIEARKHQEKFRFDLAMSTARSPLSDISVTKEENNPNLGNNLLDLVQKILAKRGFFSHTNVANIFLKQTEGLTYQEFKQSLLKYLTFDFAKQSEIEPIKVKLATKLESLYYEYNQQTWNYHLLLRTCNRLIEFLTSQNRKEPAPLFTFLATQDQYLVFALLLLKIILICRPCYSHLESCLTQLSQYYQNNNESDYQWLVKFLDSLRITLTMYSDSVQYNLVSMKTRQSQEQTNEHLANYRIFSQSKLNFNS